MATSKTRQRRQSMPQRLCDSARYRDWSHREVSFVAPVITVKFTGDDVFIKADGTPIAKRDDMEWVSLEPGWQVSSPSDHEYIDIDFDAARIQ